MQNAKSISKFEQLVKVEWTASRALNSIKAWADADAKKELQQAEYILNCVRAAGQFMLDETIPEEEKKQIMQDLAEKLYS